MFADNGFKVDRQIPIRDQAPSRLAMIQPEEIPLAFKDAGWRPALHSQQNRVLPGPDHGQSQAADIVDHSAGVGAVLVHESR